MNRTQTEGTNVFPVRDGAKQYIQKTLNKPVSEELEELQTQRRDGRMKPDFFFFSLAEEEIRKQTEDKEHSSEIIVVLQSRQKDIKT